MTAERIAQLRALEAAATPGPWIAQIRPRTIFGVGRTICAYEGMNDSALIVTARIALPEALDAIVRVRDMADAIIKVAQNDGLFYGDPSGAARASSAARAARDILAALEGESDG